MQREVVVCPFDCGQLVYRVKRADSDLVTYLDMESTTDGSFRIDEETGRAIRAAGNKHRRHDRHIWSCPTATITDVRRAVVEKR